MKKNVLPFLPARLVKGKDRWFISYYQTDPATGRRRRHKETFDLNRIKNKMERERMARQIIARINALLPHGYPYLVEFDGLARPTPIEHVERFAKAVEEGAASDVTFLDALERAVEIKCRGARFHTVKGYRSILRVATRWAEATDKQQLPLSGFTRRQAMDLLEWRLQHGNISPTTYNNTIALMRALFTELVERELTNVNPFKGIKRMRELPKKRRTFTEQERRAVLAWLEAHDYWLFRAVLLTYYCYLRVSELRRLQFRDFDFERGIIILDEHKSKNRRRNVKTLPAAIIPYFADDEFAKWPVNYLVFGVGLKPHPTKPAGHNLVRTRHRQHLKTMQQEGLLHDITGLTYYSWKDTGITDHSRMVSLLSVKDQADHSDPKVTMRYRQSDEVNLDYRRLPKMW